MCACDVYRSQLVSATPRSTDVHLLPDTGAGEGLQVQPLPVAQPTHRAVPSAGAHRTSDQDLVPEPPHEGEARDPSDPRTERDRQGGSQCAADAVAVHSATVWPLNCHSLCNVHYTDDRNVVVKKTEYSCSFRTDYWIKRHTPRLVYIQSWFDLLSVQLWLGLFTLWTI